MYKKLAGMTGTALTEAEEFYEIYKLDVVAIPTNKPVIRVDYPDQIYKTERAKADAVVREIVQMHVLYRSLHSRQLGTGAPEQQGAHQTRNPQAVGGALGARPRK